MSADAKPPWTTRRHWLALLGLVVLLAIPRVWGLMGGQPELTEPDGLVLATQAELIRKDQSAGADQILWGFYPHLVAELAALLPGPQPIAGDLEQQLSQAAREYGSVRWIVALFSLASVPLCFALARRWLCVRWSLAAACLCGASVLQLWFATQARPHAVLSVWAMVGVLASMRYAQRPTALAALGLALSCGLAIGTLQNGVLVLGPALLSLWMAHAWRAWWRALLLGLVAASVALYFYPFAWDARPGAAALGVQEGQFLLYGHRIDLSLFQGAGFATLGRALWEYDPWLKLLSLLSLPLLALTWKRWSFQGQRRQDLWLLLAFALPYMLIFGLYGRTYARFLLPLLPCVCLGIAFAASTLRIRRLESIAVLLVCVPQVILALRFAKVRAAPSTVRQAAQWIQRELRPESDRIVFLPSFELPLPYTESALEHNRVMLDNRQRPWFRYQRALDPAQRVQPGWNVQALPLAGADAFRRAREDTLAWLQEQPGDYFVVEVYTEGRKPLVLAGIHPALPQFAERIARFGPEADPNADDLPLTYSDDEYPRSRVWAWRLWEAQRMGPVIEIWKRR